MVNKYITPIVNSVSALGTLIWAIQSYKEEQNKKRLDTLFPMIMESENSESFSLAKTILDDVIIQPKTNWKYGVGYYSYSSLPRILRHHSSELIIDAGEHEIRSSFNALLDFYGKLGFPIWLPKINIMN